MAKQPDYGIDAPDVIRNLLLIGGGGFIAGVTGFIPPLAIGSVRFDIRGMLLITGLFCLGEAALMLLYARWGKFRHRDRILNQIAWKGTEQVLDVGTGRGLLLVGAAKRAPNGRAVGIDIWSSKDLSGNAQERTQENLVTESVADRATLVSEDARAMPFADSSFDVVVSNLCLHNIPTTDGRDRACREIVRVLKPGGTAVISDFRHLDAYRTSFLAGSAGVTVQRAGPFLGDTFPPLGILTVRKPG